MWLSSKLGFERTIFLPLGKLCPALVINNFWDWTLWSACPLSSSYLPPPPATLLILTNKTTLWVSQPPGSGGQLVPAGSFLLLPPATVELMILRVTMEGSKGHLNGGTQLLTDSCDHPLVKLCKEKQCNSWHSYMTLLLLEIKMPLMCKSRW